MAPAAAPTVAFDAVLYPHRSFPRERVKLLIAALIAANLWIGVPLFVMGAWPVIGFMGADVALVAWLFHLSYRSARRTETLRLAGDALEVTRCDPEGAVETVRLDAYWLRVELDDPPQHDSRLTLVSRGQRLVIGRFLTPPERAEVAVALRAALARLRRPDYEHRWDDDGDGRGDGRRDDQRDGRRDAPV